MWSFSLKRHQQSNIQNESLLVEISANKENSFVPEASQVISGRLYCITTVPCQIGTKLLWSQFTSEMGRCSFISCTVPSILPGASAPTDARAETHSPKRPGGFPGFCVPSVRFSDASLGLWSSVCRLSCLYCINFGPWPLSF